jgi:hypothetical protein
LKPDLAPPPRSVPFGVWARVAFGGLQQLGWWLFATLGAAAIWLAVVNADVSSLWEFQGEVSQAQGKVLESWKTHVSEGGSKRHPGTPIYAHRYAWKDASGIERTGVSYVKGLSLGAGSEVTIEFPKSDPDASRIQSMRRKLFGPAFGLMGLFALIPALQVAILFPRARRRASLLADGQAARGKLVAREPTNVRVNRRPVFVYRFEFKADDGQTYRAETRTHEPEKITDEAAELILYDPLDPTRSCVLDGLPGPPSISPSGDFEPLSAVPVLLGPIVAVLAHGAGAWLVFGG